MSEERAHACTFLAKHHAHSLTHARNFSSFTGMLGSAFNFLYHRNTDARVGPLLNAVVYFVDLFVYALPIDRRIREEGQFMLYGWMITNIFRAQYSKLLFNWSTIKHFHLIILRLIDNLYIKCTYAILNEGRCGNNTKYICDQCDD